jgi:hypothetical protein
MQLAPDFQPETLTPANDTDLFAIRPKNSYISARAAIGGLPDVG